MSAVVKEDIISFLGLKTAMCVETFYDLFYSRDVPSASFTNIEMVEDTNDKYGSAASGVIFKIRNGRVVLVLYALSTIHLYKTIIYQE